MPDYLHYAAPGPLTGLAGVSPTALETLPGDPAGICGMLRALVIQPHDAKALGLPAERFTENQIRSAAKLIDALLVLHLAPLEVSREPERRVIGTCRHFAVLCCALLRHRGIPARARCGFATYFDQGLGLDHWVTEYWDDSDRRWVRADPEYFGQRLRVRPEDLRPGEFLAGGEAWAAYREGQVDAARFGVYGTENWGPAEIRGNAIRDLAALNKIEMLPWDEWGRMRASYQGQTGADYDELMDEIATTSAAGDPRSLADIYARDDLRVPSDLIL